MDRDRAKTVLYAIYREVREENLTFMAGSIAYHAFVSLLPLVVLLVVTVESVGDRTLAERILAITESVLTDGGRQIVTDSLGAGREVSGVSVFGVVVLLWATLRIFRGLDQAFSDIYETEEYNTLKDQVVDGATVMVVVAAAVAATATVRSALTLRGPVGDVLGGAFVVAALTLVFLPMFYVFPDTNLRVVEVLPGTVLAAVGVTGLESAFRLYVRFSSTADYGVLGGVVVLVTWLYFNGLVVLLGAVVNAVLTNRSMDVQIDPVIGDYRAGRYGDTRDIDAEVLASHLDELRWRSGGGAPLTVTVGDHAMRLPPAGDVDVEDDPGDGGAAITFRWSADPAPDAGARPEGAGEGESEGTPTPPDGRSDPDPEAGSSG